MGIFNKLFGKDKKTSIRQREGNPDVYDFSSESDRMNWAIEKARLTLHYFEECLQNPKEGQSYLSIKARIEDGDKTEHIWLMEPHFDEEGNIFGTVGNEPIDVTTVVIDQKIGITIDYVSDWMIIEQGRLIGGYTIRAIRDGYTGDDLVNFDKSLGGMHIDEGEDYFLANLDTPEGAILSLEEAYDNDNLDKAISCKDFSKEAELMLQKTVKFDIDADIINSTAEVLQLSFANHLEENGMPKFDGIKRAFKRDFITEDHCIITETCYFPDGGMSQERLNTFRTDKQWKVLGVAE